MAEPAKSWLPVRAALRLDGLYVAVRQIEPEALQDAFMQETVARVAAPESILVLGREDLGNAPPNAAPAGLIFHVARCGSTLVSQMLKQCRDLVVYAEPLPINEILLPPHAWSRAELVGALRSLGTLLARHAGRPYVIKFSSWNTLFCDLVTEAFPGTPWALCLRNPVEVAVSLLTDTPGWLRESEEPARRLAQIVDPECRSRGREEYLAQLLGAFCDSAARLNPSNGTLLNYQDLPSAVWETLAPHFSVPVSAQQRQSMHALAGLYSKAPVGKATVFSSDATRKQAAASDELRQAISRFALPALQRLTGRY